MRKRNTDHKRTKKIGKIKTARIKTNPKPVDPDKMSEEDAAIAVAKAWLNEQGFSEGEDASEFQIIDVDVDESGAWVNLALRVSQLDIECAQDGTHIDIPHGLEES